MPSATTRVFNFSLSLIVFLRLHNSAMDLTISMPDESNKENTPPVCTKGEKKKKNNKRNPIPPMAPSFKKNGKRKILKRIPLADITHLFNNSSSTPLAQEEGNGVSSSALPSASVLLHSNSRRRTVVVVPCSKTLRMGFR